MNKKYSQGFTLIELAIVLFVMAILIGSFIGSLTSRIENNRVEETKEDLERIKHALIGYAYRNGHLPCPDCVSGNCGAFGGLRDGVEDRGFNGVPDGSCSTQSNPGSVPWVTLGLGRGDAWGNRYYYWAHETFSRDGTNPNPLFRRFNLSDPQTPADAQNPVMAQIFNRNADGTATVQIADNVIAVVFSSGKNSFGSRSTDDAPLPAIPVANVDEVENRDANDVTDPATDPMIFISRPPTSANTTTAGGEFDDIVIWLTDYELKAKMVEAGVLP